MNLTIYFPSIVAPEKFVEYWSDQYDYAPDDEQYSKHLNKPLTAEAVLELFRWKNGSKLSTRKLRSVETNYIARLDEISALPLGTAPEQFLRRFSTGGAIWRIFWLHCWQPDRFPIYDQHVHRAMTHIQTGQIEEIHYWSDARKISAYLQRYLPFCRTFSHIDSREVDRALWSFGKFIKSWSFPRSDSMRSAHNNV